MALGICTVIAGSVYLGVTLLERSKKIETLVMSRVSQQLGSGFEVGSISPGWFSVYLQNISIKTPDSSATITLKDLRVGFSIRKLLVSYFNFGTSISSVVISAPVVELRPWAQKKIPQVSAPSRINLHEVLQQFIESFGVAQVAFKKGSVILVLKDRDRIVLASNLSGGLSSDSAGILFGVKGGGIAGNGKVSVSGRVSRGEKRHVLSYRIDKSRLTKPLSIGTLKLDKAAVDVVGEVTWNDTLGIGGLDCSGRAQLSGGVLIVSGIAEPITAVGVNAHVNGTMITIDSLFARSGSMQLRGEGRLSLVSADSNRVFVHLTGIQPDDLATRSAGSVGYDIIGSGWVNAMLTTPTASRGAVAQFKAGGLTFWGDPLLECAGRISGIGDSLTKLDSVSVYTPHIQITGSGVLSGGDRYVIDIAARADSLLAFPLVCGNFDAQVSLRGTVGSMMGNAAQSDVQLNSTIKAVGLCIGDVSIGDITCAVRNHGARLVASTAGNASNGFTFFAWIDSLGTRYPRSHVAVALTDSLILAKVVARYPAAKSILGDSLAVSLKLDNWGIRRATTGSVIISSERVDGTFSLAAWPRKSHLALDSQTQWVVSSNSLKIGDSTILFSAYGRMSRQDSLLIDSCDIGGYVSGRLSVGLGRQSSIDGDFSVAPLPLSLLAHCAAIDPAIVTGGTVGGSVHLMGTPREVQTSIGLRIRQCGIGGVGSFDADLAATTAGEWFTVLPFTVRKARTLVMWVDTFSNQSGHKVSGRIGPFELGEAVAGSDNEHKFSGQVSAWFSADSLGAPVSFLVQSPHLQFDTYGVDSVKASGEFTTKELVVKRISARDSTRTTLTGWGRVPWAYFGRDRSPTDTLTVHVLAKGDLLASVQRHIDSPVGGTGVGTIEVECKAIGDKVTFPYAKASIPDGVLRVRYFIPGDIKPFSFSAGLSPSGKLSLGIQGFIRKRPITVTASHTIPQGYMPFVFGPIDCGVLLVNTPRGGVDIHIPGLMAIDQYGNVEAAPRPGFESFALCGPLDHFKICGTVIVRNADLAFPFLTDEKLPWPANPFPYLSWELDLKVGNNNVNYYYDLGPKFVRVFECAISPTSAMSLRGRELDKNFHLLGTLRSTKGSVYYGKSFDRNLSAGVDFVPELLGRGMGYNNIPIVWGSVEAVFDTNRFDRIKLTLMTRDSITGSVSERGRLQNFFFKLSSDFAEMPGQAERQFYTKAGLQFTTIAGAGAFASDVGEQFLHRTFLAQGQKTIARTLGLDFVQLETFFARNYFSNLGNRQNGILAKDKNVFANTGLTIGRYFFDNYVLVKASGQLMPQDTSLMPEYSLGIELQPMRYLLFDFNYGINFLQNTIGYNPQIQFQLQLPLRKSKSIGDYFDYLKNY